MPLVNSALILGYLETFRVCNIGGRFGGGKTALGFRLARELIERKKVRHIVSNVQSVWNDDPAHIQLVNGQADVAIILDEAGLFLETGRDAKKFLAYLRKLNVILIMPTVLEPAARIRFLTVQRIMNLEVMAFPMWLYRLDLIYGRTKEKGFFGWWKPREIFGIYDTKGYPSDDGGLAHFQKKWTEEVALGAGYERTANKSGSIDWAAINGGTTLGQLPTGETGVDTGENNSTSRLLLSLVEEIRGFASEVDESSARTENALSIHAEGRKSRRR